jgi:hypothetical protein
MSKNYIVSQGAEGASDPIRVDSSQPNFKLGLFTRITPAASLTYTVEYCYQDPEGESFAASPDWRAVSDITGATGDDQALWEIPVQMVRLNVTVYASGSVTLEVVQPY